MKRIIFIIMLCFLISSSVFVNKRTEVNNIETKTSYVDIKETKDIESRLMTYDQMFNLMLKDGYTKDEVLKIMGPKSMDRSRGDYYVNLDDSFIVKFTRCTVRFYARVEQAHGQYAIGEILNAHFDSGKKVFNGTLFYNLESVTRLYYNAYGHLHKDGNLSISGGGSIGVGQNASINFSVSYSSPEIYSGLDHRGYIHYGNA